MPRYKTYNPSENELLEALEQQVQKWEKIVCRTEAIITQYGSTPSMERTLELAIKNRDRIAHARNQYKAMLES